MRPTTTQSRNLSLKSNTKSMTTLHELKKTTQNFPSLRNQLIIQKTNRASFKQLKGKGKLHLGSISKPVMILSKQQRLNPWGKRTIISEQIVVKKGLLNLAHMGILSRQYDCIDLLNNKYQLIPQKQIQKQRQTLPSAQKEAFITTPQIMDAYYEVQQKNQIYQETKQKSKDKIQQKAIRRRSATKKKIVKQQPKFQFVIEDHVRLTVLNFHIDKNDTYQQYLKKLRRNGLAHLFKIYQRRIQEFAQKYNFKKFTILPKLNETKKLTQREILNSIVNHKLLGMDLKVKGERPSEIFRWLLLMKVQKIRYKHLRIAINRIEKVKNKFKIKKVYRQMIEKRWKFVNFKFGSFAENQRRLIQDNITINKKPEVEIHILASISTATHLQTYYKWNQRKKAQLTRLYNNESDHIILILNKQHFLQNWLQDILSLPSSWKKPKIDVFFSSMDHGDVQQYADIYFGLTRKQILQIKKICQGKTAVVIPYQITIYLPKICQTLGVNLLAGTFTQQSKNMLFEEDQQQEINKQSSNSPKFKKLQLCSKDLNRFYIQKFKQIQLANEIFQSKSQARKLFQSLKMPTPVSISIEDINQCDFFRQFVKTILTYKQYSKWILKLPDSNFSRGLAFLQTQSLKIIKDTKKKPFLLEQHINQITKIIEQILIQKIYMPHQSLMNGDQFITLFKRNQGYIESVIENPLSICIFGRIQMNGVFTLLGSCKKYYAQNICFGALYPAEQVNNEMIKHINNATSKLYELGVFGYISFQLLVNQKTKDYYFIDLTPHLDEYSSFYFYYKRMLDINELDNANFLNTLKRYVFYCPFIDNNGNKFKTIKHLQDKLQQKKLKFDQPNLQGFKYLYLNQDVPNVVSIVSFSTEQRGAVKHCLDALKFLVENGGEFNKFDKKYKNSQTDGLYIMDIMWKMRQLKKEVDK